MSATFLARAIGWSEPTFDGIFGVENSGTGPIFVREIQVRPAGGCTGQTVVGTGTLPGKFRISRISGFAGEVAATITPFPHRTDATALPSQVQLVARPDSVTEVSVLRSFVPTDSLMAQNITRTISPARGGTDGQADLFNSYDGVAQPVTLREGEGLAVLKTEADLPAARRFRVMFTIAATGATWEADFVTTARGAPDGCSFCLMNGTGSGVVLIVKLLEHIDNGEGANSNISAVDGFPCFRLVRGEGCLGGTDVTPLSPVSGSAPSTIRFVRGPFQHVYMGVKSGVGFDLFSTGGALGLTIAAQMQSGVLRRGQNNGIGIDINDARIGLNPPDWDSFYSVEENREGIQVNPGESVSIVGGRQGVTNTSVFDTYDVTFVCTLPTPRTVTTNYQRGIS